MSDKSRKEVVKEKGFGGGGKFNVEEAEQFLCSMLGDDTELSMAVVKDVLCEWFCSTNFHKRRLYDKLSFFFCVCLEFVNFFS